MASLSPVATACGAELSTGLTVASGAALDADLSCTFGTETWNIAGVSATYTTSAATSAGGGVTVDAGGYLILSNVATSANGLSVNGALAMNGNVEVVAAAALAAGESAVLLRWLDTTCADITASASVFGCPGCTLAVQPSNPAEACYLVLQLLASPSPSPSPSPSAAAAAAAAAGDDGSDALLLLLLLLLLLPGACGFAALWRRRQAIDQSLATDLNASPVEPAPAAYRGLVSPLEAELPYPLYPDAPLEPMPGDDLPQVEIAPLDYADQYFQVGSATPVHGYEGEYAAQGPGTPVLADDFYPVIDLEQVQMAPTPVDDV